MIKMDDYTLWNTQQRIEQHANDLFDEIKRRGLLTKPLEEWSNEPRPIGTEEANDG